MPGIKHPENPQFMKHFKAVDGTREPSKEKKAFGGATLQKAHAHILEQSPHFLKK